MAGGKRIQRRSVKPITHRFLDRHTVSGALLLTLWAYVGAQVLLGAVLSFPLLLFLPEGPAVSLAVAAGSLILLAVHKRWFAPEFEGCLTGKDLRPALLPLALIALTIWIPSIIECAVDSRLGAPTLDQFATALMAGVSEEVIFRGIPGSYLMRQWREEGKIPFVLFFTSALFSLTHAFNLFAGATLSGTVVQLIFTFALGFLFCAIFLRTGSLLPCILIHAAHDIISFLDKGSYDDGGVLVATMSGLDYAVNIGVSALMLGVAIYMTRPAKQKDILTIWAEKWGGAGNRGRSDESPANR